MYKMYISEIKNDKVKNNGTLVIEILPEKLVTSGGKDNITRNMLGIGEVVQPGRPTLRTWQVSSVFEPFGNMNVEDSKNLIMAMVESSEPFSLTIIRTHEDGSEDFSTDVKAVLQKYEFEERAGEPGTLYYKLTLQEYQPFVAVKVKWGSESFDRAIPRIKK